MDAIQADYNGAIHLGNEVKTTFVVQRQAAPEVWHLMGCQWDTLDDAVAHMRRLTGVVRVARVTVEVVMAADVYEQQNQERA